MDVAFLHQSIDFPQRVFGAASRAEAVAARPEPDLEDQLDGHRQRRLHDAVLHSWYAQRASFAPALGYLHPSDRARPIRACPQAFPEFPQVRVRFRFEPLDAHRVDSSRPLVRAHFPPCGLQRRGADGLIHQTEPLASLALA
jgi:hypothetical protein